MDPSLVVCVCVRQERNIELGNSISITAKLGGAAIFFSTVLCTKELKGSPLLSDIRYNHPIGYGKRTRIHIFNGRNLHVNVAAPDVAKVMNTRMG